MSACRIFASMMFFFSSTCFAFTCRSTEEPLSASLYAAAPEMLVLDNHSYCVSARQVIDTALAKAAVVSAPSTIGAAGYVPKTKDDNTPWRFDMNQNGKRMTAEEFDAWMKAKGIHVATGKAQTGVSAKAQD